MQTLKKISFPIILLILMFLVSAWGYSGHKRISEKAPPAFPPILSFLLGEFSTVLVSNASEADFRKEWDDTEAPKHYIDIDNYVEFIYSGKIPQSFDSVVKAHGLSFVIENGTIPWSTLATYDSLKNCFARQDLVKAALFAADLGHYVGDAHMPLHLTANYNGWNTGQGGIHSRYESTMIKAHINQLVYTVDTAKFIPNVQSYIFTYIYANYVYVDSVLQADREATILAGNDTSSLYTQALWERTGDFTIRLFQHASFSLASLIYTAYIESQSISVEDHGKESAGLGMIYPNPSCELSIIPFVIDSENSKVSLRLVGSDGRITPLISGERMSRGHHEVKYDVKRLPSGLYHCILETDQRIMTKKLVVIH